MKWFKHYSDASDDAFIEELEEIFSWEGYGRWWKLLEIIASAMEKNNEPAASHSWVKWQALLKGKRNKLETFLIHCENKGKLKLEQNGNILKIICPKLLELRDNHTKNLQATEKKLAPKTKDIRDKNKSSIAAHAGDGINLFQKIYDAGAELFPSLATANMSSIHQWLNAGCDPDLDVIPELKRHAEKDIKAWSYFTGGIMDAMATRTTPAPAGSAHGRYKAEEKKPEMTQEERDAQRARVTRAHFESGRASVNFGEHDRRWLAEHDAKNMTQTEGTA